MIIYTFIYIFIWIYKPSIYTHIRCVYIDIYVWHRPGNPPPPRWSWSCVSVHICMSTGLYVCMSPRSPLSGGVWWWGVCIHDKYVIYLCMYVYIYTYINIKYICIYVWCLKYDICKYEYVVMVMCVGAYICMSTGLYVCMSPRSPLWGGVWWWGVCIHDKYVMYIYICIYIHT